jgi:hypothetical protein
VLWYVQGVGREVTCTIKVSESGYDEVLMLVLVVTPPSGIRGLLGSECGGLGWSMVDRVVPKVMVPECRG